MAPSTKFAIVNKFRGYHQKEDITNLPDGTLVEGSQNVLLNEGERVASRRGYSLDGQANAALNGIESAYDWLMHIGQERHLRAYDDELEYRYVDDEGTVTWRRLENSFSSVAFNYAEFWDTTEEIDQLLFVNGSSNIYQWSGGITTFASATVNTITKEGVTTWGEESFYAAGTRRVIIGGTAYTYTGGEGTTTITGVTPDPTLGGYAAGEPIHQQIRTTANSSITDLPNTFQNDLISSLYNQVYIGSFISREVYISKVDSFTDFSFTVPVRLVGEGAILTLDGTPKGFIPQEEFMYITGGLNDWYRTNFALSADNASQTLTVDRLKTNAQAAAQSQALITKIKNDVVFVSLEPTLDTLGRLEVILTPQSVNISEPVKTLFDRSDFTDGQAFYYQNDVYISLPNEGKVLIYNLSKGFWEAPQILPISRFAIIDGLLYGHSSEVPETYRLFTGYNDNGNPINAIARFSYQQFGDRANLKTNDEYYTEGYITSNTTLVQRVRYDYLGASGIEDYNILGSDTRIIFSTTSGDDGSLGKQSLGKRSLAGRGATVDETLPPKFRVIKTMAKTDFYEQQVQYSSNETDARWELLAFGPNVTPSVSDNNAIKE